MKVVNTKVIEGSSSRRHGETSSCQDVPCAERDPACHVKEAARHMEEAKRLTHSAEAYTKDAAEHHGHGTAIDENAGDEHGVKEANRHYDIASEYRELADRHHRLAFENKKAAEAHLRIAKHKG